MRQLQIRDGLAVAEWIGSGSGPVPPDVSWTFVDVTDRPDAQVGHSYDADTDTFTAPPPAPDYGQTVSPREFMLLFGPEAWLRCVEGAKADPGLAYFLALAQAPEPIRLKHPTTLAGLAMCVSQGLLTEQQADDLSNGVAL